LPVCRRMKRCVGRDIRCQRDLPPLNLTPEEKADVQARMYNALRKRRAELEGS
jgi:predicted DNA-binding transcriptional regulator YafY